MGWIWKLSSADWWTASLNYTRLSLWFPCPSVCVVSVPLPCMLLNNQPTIQYSLSVWITHVCMCQTIVMVSCSQWCLIVSPLFLNTLASEMLQSGPAMEHLLWGFAVNINIYLHKAFGILMGGHSSLLRLWNKITWYAAVPINAVPES